MRHRFLLKVSLLAAAALAAWLGSVSLARAQATDGDELARAGRHREAAETYQRAFEETRDPTWWKRAGQEYLALGGAGREDAIRAFRLYIQNADDEAQAQEGRDLLAEAKALPADAPPTSDSEPPPVAPEAGTAPVAATALPAAAPLAPAAPPSSPAGPPEPIDEVAGARWSNNVGFWQPAPEGSEAATEAKSPEAPVLLPLPVLTLDQTTITLGAGNLLLRPISQGIAGDDARMNLLELAFEIEGRGRPVGAVLGPWVALESRVAFGKRKDYSAVAGATTGSELDLVVVHFAGRFGLDLFPVEFLGFGPTLGYRMDGYIASLESDAEVAPGTETDSSEPLRPDHGPELGLHLRLGTRPHPTEPARFVADFMVAQRFGKANSVASGLEARVWLEGVYLVGWAETRVSSNGSFTYVPATPASPSAGDTAALDLSDAFARAAPIERRLGAGLEFVPGRKRQ